MKVFRLMLVPMLLLGVLSSPLIAQAQNPKGWSPQAKGAVIGGLGGAAAGAIINKRNRPVGGVVGGVVGAGAGYAIGKHIDNKQKQRAAAARAAEANAYQSSYRSEGTRSSARRSSGKHTAAAGMALAATAPTQAEALNAGYLPNPTTGPAAAAYPESEYRRKSW